VRENITIESENATTFLFEDTKIPLLADGSFNSLLLSETKKY